MIDGHIALDEPAITPRQREQDDHIVDMAVESNWFTSKEIRVMNYCRLYLGVELISDVAIASGTHLDKALV